MSKRLSKKDFERAIRRADENAPMELAREAQRARDEENRLEALLIHLLFRNHDFSQAPRCSLCGEIAEFRLEHEGL